MTLHKFLFTGLLFLSAFANAKTVIVKNAAELNTAAKEAMPGDIVVLQNGTWNDITISINCEGTKAQPVIFKAQTAGKVIITGNSSLRLGGNYIIVDGFYFTNGFAGNDPVIRFRTGKDQLANNCRVTNTVINDFNNPKRMDENYWVAFYGKSNRIDHCSFLNKKNMGVLMAVILEDERSRQNFHSIDHNYFGVRLPLASNGGEIIRVGVSQHCEFNSNTQITDNFFEHCDGETEIISIKSCSNIIRNNLFKECQGSVVLRHGNYNTVENNIFLGNNKEGTGGVRVINKGQWVVNNLFYKCRGEWFRSPLTLMNGVPNSPAFRYVAVTEAVIANNSFFDCSPIGFCIGSDTERTVTPSASLFMNNLIYNKTGGLIYNTYDDISRIGFFNNLISKSVNQSMVTGFDKYQLTSKKYNSIEIPNAPLGTEELPDDSLNTLSRSRLAGRISSVPGLSDIKTIIKIEASVKNTAGAAWFKTANKINTGFSTINCRTTEELKAALAKQQSNKTIKINLTGESYIINEPFSISGDVTITSGKKNIILINSTRKLWPYVIEIEGGSTLKLIDIKLDLSSINAASFITSDLNGSSGHSNLIIKGCSINNMNATFFNAVKSTVFDSFVVKNNSFSGNKGTLFNFSNETDKKGYYNVEEIKMTANNFINNEGQIITMLRGGNDESTMGPYFIFRENNVENYVSTNGEALIHLFGTQRSNIETNKFTNANSAKTLILYEDLVRSVHLLGNNKMTRSGNILTNKFVSKKD
jgi:poly(beta-D-mannuronate) lyase